MSSEKKNPIATMHMASGADIVIELLPEAAPNTVASFIHLAKLGVFDGHAIQRICPGRWVDMSYSAFGREEAKYLIPFESKLHPEIEPLDSHPGCVCMGGYEDGIAGGEFFFPVKDCPNHKGIYPVFGHVISGMDEIYRIEKVPTKPVGDGRIEHTQFLARAFVEQAFHTRLIQSVLVAEMVVDQRDVDFRRLADLPHGHELEALLGK